MQKVEITTIQGLKEKYEGDKNTIMSTLGLSEGEAWRALRHYNWCAAKHDNYQRALSLLLCLYSSTMPPGRTARAAAWWLLRASPCAEQ